jgi:hypothetical protein
MNLTCDGGCQLTYLRRRDDGALIVYCEDHRRESAMDQEVASFCDIEECEAVVLAPRMLCPRHSRRSAADAVSEQPL